MNKGLFVAAMLAISLIGASPAMAWNCPSGAAWDIEANACVVIGPGMYQVINQNPTVKQKQSATATSSASSTATANATASANNNGDGSNNTDISSYASSPKIPVSTAYAPSLTAGADTCLGSISGGAQTSFLGVSVGGTKHDQNCEHIKNTHLIMEFNREAGCDYMLKNVPGAREAFEEVGANCRGVVVVVTSIEQSSVPIVVSTPVSPIAIPPVILKSPTE